MSTRIGRAAIWSVIVLLCLLRFWRLSADFPNNSPWLSDQAKFTDEGWWAQAAILHHLTGHWILPGDYNAAVATPVWPLLLSALFHWTGVSLLTARGLSVVLSLATMVVVFLLVRRYTSQRKELIATLAVLLLAASPFAFAFSRLAILESLLILQFSLLLLSASFVSTTSWKPFTALALLATTLVLTKTTAALLLPAVFWLAWRNQPDKPAAAIRSFCALFLAPAGIFALYRCAVEHWGLGDDFRYFYEENGMPDIDWSHSWSTLTALAHHGFWIDRGLYPAALFVTLLALLRYKELWRNPLFTAAWISIAAQAAFIFSRQDDSAPRYFLPMLLPMTLIVVLALDTLPRKTFHSLLPAVVLIAGVDGFRTISFVRHPAFAMANAAQSIQHHVAAEPAQSRLLLGVSAGEVSLMTGLPSLNDAFGTEDLGSRAARLKPGWLLVWTGVGPEERQQLTPFDLEPVDSYRIFDNADRDNLLLYRLKPRR
ncbi:MAG TPA: glycosyltransferase family 39 protein [Acidobacteriaceae bacterium]|jgi:hypothetical protein